MRTHIAFVLDKSGSMRGQRNLVIAEFNKQIGLIQDGSFRQQSPGEKPGKKIIVPEAEPVAAQHEITLSLCLFSDDVTWPVWLQPADKLHKLTEESYVPDGSTALYDAIGGTIKRLQQEAPAADDFDTSFLVLILTDGEENFSTQFKGKNGWSEITDLIKKLEGTKRWTFAYLVSGLDIEKLQVQIGSAMGAFYKGAGVTGPVGSAGPRGWQSALQASTRSLSHFLRGREEKGIRFETAFFDASSAGPDIIDVDASATVPAPKAAQKLTPEIKNTAKSKK